MRVEVPEKFEDVTVAYVEEQLALEPDFKIYRGRLRWCIAISNTIVLIAFFQIFGPRPLSTLLLFIVNINLCVVNSIPLADALAAKRFRGKGGTLRAGSDQLWALRPDSEKIDSLDSSQRKLALGILVLNKKRLRDRQKPTHLRTIASIACVAVDLVLMALLPILSHVKTYEPNTVFLIAVLCEAAILTPTVFVCEQISSRREASHTEQDNDLELRFRSSWTAGA